MKLAKNEVKARLAGMEGWKFDDDEIEKKYRFQDFKQSMLFVNAVADAAEAMDHHPDIEIKYNRVEITLSTHSDGGVTEKDFELAGKIDEAAAGVSAHEDGGVTRSTGASAAGGG
jgi:4a-hydroxytetrahydrobiopterin dehydratase